MSEIPSAKNQAEQKIEIPRKYLQEEFLENVSEEIRLDGHYIVLLVFSTLIAVLGLLINSAAVVIGAMLISPLFWPILGITVSIITNRQRLARRSSLNLIVSILIVLIIGYLVASISPLSQVTQEISSRTNPTLLDLFIALAASVIGVLAIYHPRISQSTSGVAISIALLPALCVSGIGIAFRSSEIFIGSFLLFAANMGSIIFVGATTLYLLKFRPRKAEEKSRMRWGFAFSFIFLFILSIPLSFFLRRAINQNQLSGQINEILKTEVATLSEQAKIDRVHIKFPQQFQTHQVNIEATILLPEGVNFTTSQRSAMITKLSDQLKSNVDLQLNLVNTLVLKQAEDEQLRTLRQNIQNEINNNLVQKEELVTFESIDIHFSSESNRDLIKVLIVMKDSFSQIINYSDKIKLEEQLSNRFNTDFQVEIEFIPIRRLSDISELSRLESELTLLLKTEFAQISPQIKLRNLELKSLTAEEFQILEATPASQSAILGIESAQIVAAIDAPEDVEITPQQKEILEDRLENNLEVDLSLTILLSRYQPI